jgi:hypothetical protein
MAVLTIEVESIEGFKMDLRALGFEYGEYTIVDSTWIKPNTITDYRDEEKTAYNLSNDTLASDSYHQAIASTAQEVARYNPLALYVTQYASGTCVWSIGETTVSVKYNPVEVAPLSYDCIVCGENITTDNEDEVVYGMCDGCQDGDYLSAYLPPVQADYDNY